MIYLMPFKSVFGFCDLHTSDIFISSRLNTCQFLATLEHEVDHILSDNPDDNFTPIRREYSIPSNIAANIGNISGIQNILTDYHLLQAYRKFSQRVLGTEGHWEVINEGSSNVESDSLSAKDQLIRLYPTPKGAFPVVVLYTPVITHFRSPQARQLCYDMMLAEAKVALGSIRRKVQGMPTPDGGTISYDGNDLVQEGIKEKEEIIQKAINLGEPPGIWMY